MQEIWQEIMERVPPTIRTWLKQATCQQQGSEILIGLSDDMGLLFLERKNVAAWMANVFSERLGTPISVRFAKRTGIEVLQEELVDEQLDRELSRAREAIAEEAKPRQKHAKSSEDVPANLLYGKPFKGEPTPMIEIGEGVANTLIVQGEVLAVDVRALKNGGEIMKIDLTDHEDSVSVKLFGKEGKPLPKVTAGDWLRVRGGLQLDTFAKEMVLMARDILKVEPPTVRDDGSSIHRVELHVHTKMSTMDGLIDLKSLFARVKHWQHPAVAITDHGVVQSFPEAYQLGKKFGIKVLYGLEAYVEEEMPLLDATAPKAAWEEISFVAFDFETTGLSPQGAEIIEIGAVKFQNGKVIDTFSTFVASSRPIPSKITELTGIHQAMLADAPSMAEILPPFLDFLAGSVLVAHNAAFDLGFLRHAVRKHLKKNFAEASLDSLVWARFLLPELKSHSLASLAKRWAIAMGQHHRALDDAKTLMHIHFELVQLSKEQQYLTLSSLYSAMSKRGLLGGRPQHVMIMAKNLQGLQDMYRVVSKSHLENFYRVPRLRYADLEQYRQNWLIGSACTSGPIYDGMLRGHHPDEMRKRFSYFDYIEMLPRDTLRALIAEGSLSSYDELDALQRQILQMAQQMSKPVVVTSDVHYLDPEDALFRNILVNGSHDDHLRNAKAHFPSTGELLVEFTRLFDAKTAEEIVVQNSHWVMDQCEEMKPVPDELYVPHLPGAEEQVRTLAEAKAKAWYGESLPLAVQSRLDKELQAIIGNGFAVIYLIAHKLVTKSLSDGYLVGSRGSVGSSLVATFIDITEVNPLAPHYRCAQCQYSEFVMDPNIFSGVDLPDKSCPICQSDLLKDGHDIPFETFLGFDGDKVPDIDLNFSGDYQPQVHRYTEELFGRANVYRAGTIATVAERTAFGFVKGYLEESGRVVRSAEMQRLALGLTGVKRTTGQHPGGLMIIPQDLDVHQFTPVQHPADDVQTNIETTHFDYHSLSERLLKLDILGHDDPTVLRMLEDLTGVSVRDVPLSDPKTLALFSSVDSLGVSPEAIGTSVGSLGLPEFGTRFVRNMLVETQPTTFGELVRISGLSHGTDVWANNAQDLVRASQATLKEVISTRDDIMVYLLRKGLPAIKAFKIMEDVRKGRGLKAEDVTLMTVHGIPEWYIASCQKIKYMFPKAHATAYVTMAVRIAWFKVYRPDAFYATYFTVRADEFDGLFALRGLPYILESMSRIEGLGNEASTKDKNLFTILEIAREMYARGLTFRPVSLLESDATRFQITPSGLLPPFVALQGLGRAQAFAIMASRKDGPFLSVEDLRKRTRLAKPVLQLLEEQGALTGLSLTNQMTLFG